MKSSDSKILVAIQCLVYNHEQYLRACLEGFVMQKTNFCFVAVVHDDASTDKSSDIIREYAAKYPNIIKPIFEEENQFSKKNGSVMRIVNNYIAASGAKYVAICEGDDYWIDPQKLQKQVDYMEAHPLCSCCAHNSLTLYTNTREIGLFNNKVLITKDYTLESFITRDWFSPTQSLLYRSEAYTDFDDKPSFMHGDYSILINILLPKDSYLHYENDIMSVYRKGGWTSTNYKEIDLWNDFISMLKYYKEKSNHRCDAIFDKQIEREEQGKQQALKYQQDCKKSHSLLVRTCHWLCRQFAKIANHYSPCIQVTKRVEREELPNLEVLD